MPKCRVPWPRRSGRETSESWTTIACVTSKPTPGCGKPSPARKNRLAEEGEASSVTETLIFIAILGVLLLQLLGRFLERMRVSEAVPEQRSADEELDRQPLPDRSSETPVLAKPYPPGLPQL